MTKLKEPIYEFGVNIHYLPIYIKKKMSIVQAKLLIKKKKLYKTKIINQANHKTKLKEPHSQKKKKNSKNPSLNLMRIFIFCQYCLLSKAKLLI